MMKASGRSYKFADIFDAIAAMTEAPNWESSDVRIYCDNDDQGPGKRWQPVPDVKGVSKKKANSNQPFDKQLWWDHINEIYRAYGSKGVQDTSNGVGLGQTYTLTFDGESDQKKGRQSITVCLILPMIWRCLHFLI